MNSACELPRRGENRNKLSNLLALCFLFFYCVVVLYSPSLALTTNPTASSRPACASSSTSSFNSYQIRSSLNQKESESGGERGNEWGGSAIKEQEMLLFVSFFSIFFFCGFLDPCFCWLAVALDLLPLTEHRKSASRLPFHALSE